LKDGNFELLMALQKGSDIILYTHLPKHPITLNQRHWLRCSSSMTLMIANLHIVCQGMTLKIHAAGFRLMPIGNVYDSDAAFPKPSHVNLFVAMLAAKCSAVRCFGEELGFATAKGQEQF
jgi:hypothetical protein